MSELSRSPSRRGCHEAEARRKLGRRLVPLLAAEGFDADSVRDEGLSGSQDEAVYDVCKSSERVLITLDLDFSNPLRFPPAETRGIVVVRPPRASTSP